MGIRFYCPDCGRRLNIKAFLAGKRGICPHCDSRVLIPMESQLPADAPKYRPTSEAAAENSPNGPATATAEQQATAAVTKESTGAPTATSDATDPIAEAPDSVWYVRPPAGGQYGPARGDVMRRWLAEGRVSADSMVWREGWADWQVAGPIFPSLEGASTTRAIPKPNQPSATNSAPSFLVPEDEEQDISKPVAAPERRVTGRKKSVLPLIILGLLIVVLLVVTVIILQRGGS